MPIVVQKYGGSSVADVEKIRKVAAKVRAKRESGYEVVVVVSAMGDTTDELLALAKQVSADPPRRELDMLLTCGERISMALLSMALQELGVPAISFTGSQSGIITDDAHSQARIVEVRPYRIHDALAQHKVVIVAGYQGVSYKREVTSLGRGGSDTTAVALAAALAAEACEIYSDVDGVFSADPRVVPGAKKLADLSFDEMQELASAGAKVLNAQAVEFAKQKGIVILAKSSFGGGTGTAVSATAPSSARVKAVASEAELLVLSLSGGASRLTELLEFLDARGVRGRALSLDACGSGSAAASSAAGSSGAASSGSASSGAGSSGAASSGAVSSGPVSSGPASSAAGSSGAASSGAASSGSASSGAASDVGGAYLAVPLQDVHGLDVLRRDLALRFQGAVRLHEGLGTVTCVGAGIHSDFGVTRKALAVAEELGVRVHGVHISPLSLSVLAARDNLPELTRRLHRELLG